MFILKINKIKIITIKLQIKNQIYLRLNHLQKNKSKN